MVNVSFCVVNVQKSGMNGKRQRVTYRHLSSNFLPEFCIMKSRIYFRRPINQTRD